MHRTRMSVATLAWMIAIGLPVAAQEEEVASEQFLQDRAQLQAMVDERQTDVYELDFRPLDFDRVLVKDRTGTEHVYHYMTFRIVNRVSDNAQGGFTVALLENPISSGLRDGMNHPIEPVEFENLTVVVRPNLVALIDGLNGVERVPECQIDLDRNGRSGPADVLKAISMLTGGP